MGDAILARNTPETIWWPDPIRKLTVLPRPVSWRSLIRRGVMGRGIKGRDDYEKREGWRRTEGYEEEW